MTTLDLGVTPSGAMIPPYSRPSAHWTSDGFETTTRPVLQPNVDINQPYDSGPVPAIMGILHFGHPTDRQVLMSANVVNQFLFLFLDCAAPPRQLLLRARVILTIKRRLSRMCLGPCFLIHQH